MKDYSATSIASLQGKLCLESNYSNQVYVICLSFSSNLKKKSVDEWNCLEYFAWAFSINRCVGLKRKCILKTQESRALGKRVIPCLSMKECSIASATALQNEEYSIIPTQQDMGFVTEWIYNFLILSPLSLFPISRVLSDISLREKYLQDKPALWRAMGTQ